MFDNLPSRTDAFRWTHRRQGIRRQHFQWWVDCSVDCLDENEQSEIEAVVAAVGLQAAIFVEIYFGDDAVMALADAFREAADKIELRLGDFIKKNPAQKTAHAD